MQCLFLKVFLNPNFYPKTNNLYIYLENSFFHYDFRRFFLQCLCVQVKFSMLEIYNEVAQDDFLIFFYSVCV
jgi:hypothetical protein